MTDRTQDAVVIERTFDEPIDVIWQMWTNPTHVAAWYGPHGATIPEITMDVRVGGHRRLRMDVTTPSGLMQMWFDGEYLEVDEPNRLVFTEVMTQAAAPTQHPGGDHSHPTPITEVIVELEDLDGRTKMVMTHVGIPADSPGAAGWTMAFEKMTAHAATIHRD
jgi:uncharacterized protein YndB with AHSA1/START domain